MLRCGTPNWATRSSPARPEARSPSPRTGSRTPPPTPRRSRRGGRSIPDANIGIPTAGLLVVDVDDADNPWPADPALAEDLACGPVSLTPRGGRHHIFRQPDGQGLEEHGGARSHRRSIPGPMAATSSCRPRSWTGSRTAGRRRSNWTSRRTNCRNHPAGWRTCSIARATCSRGGIPASQEMARSRPRSRKVRPRARIRPRMAT